MREEPAGFAQPKPDPDRQAVGERLRQAREYVGLKQDEVARHLGIPRSALSNIEGGLRRVEVTELTRLAKLYQRPIAWFAGAVEAPSDQLPEEVRHVARTAAALSDQDRRELANFADFLRSRARSKSDGNG